MKKTVLTILLSILITSCSNETSKSSENKSQKRIENHIDSVSYAIGLDVAMRLEEQFKDIDHDMLSQAINDFTTGKELFLSDKERLAVIKKYNDITVPKYRMDKEKLNIVEGGKFLDENLKVDGVIEHKSGIQYKVIKEGTGPNPEPNDNVQVHYKGTLIDGTKFDSSYDRGEPAVFPVSRVVPGFSQGLLLMNVGSTYQFFIPGHLGYGQGDGPGGPMAVMIFEVEMLNIIKEPTQQ
ncbi:MAG: FKBP-type peptidyl-prolyl cis-trans isomerase [Pelagibacteraceae bacterium]|jgi:FKBP-type peptidyl-prolyl cis-trans isomerase FkpA/FKBP-type peptidyl-prolyl cis-trans isomerase FklB|nr:FKBP-type peptidyl-prolyl cis-trans isomerase [Pelagibacteraceae bacterium]